MSPFLRDLAWKKHPEDFSWAEQRILLALSNERWDWRTVDNLKAIVELSEPDMPYPDHFLSSTQGLSSWKRGAARQSDTWQKHIDNRATV